MRAFHNRLITNAASCALYLETHNAHYRPESPVQKRVTSFDDDVYFESYIQGMFKNDRTFTIKTSFYNFLSTVPFKVVPSTGDTLFPTFLPLLECFLECTFCDGAQFSYRIFLNLRLFKKT
jgi:hypothetical protein